MSPLPLKRSYRILTLASDLGIKPSRDPVRDILRFCERRVQRFRRDFPECATLSHLLEICASKLGTGFEEIYTGVQLDEVQARYMRQGERAFAGLYEELSPAVFGITFKRLSRRPWELPYVSVIDCRGDKKFRSYYTKWHELGHLLILTDQMRLTFCRTHIGSDDKDPEEVLVDAIAGAFGFLPDFVRPLARGEPSFTKIESIRTRLCPEASVVSSLIGIVRAWPVTCILLQARMGLKRGERRALIQGSLGFQEEPRESLRAVQITPNEKARNEGFVIFPNMRVPERSIIYKAFTGKATEDKAGEDLSWWWPWAG